MDRDNTAPQVKGPFTVYTGGRAHSQDADVVSGERRRASSVVNELFWAMNQCAGPDGLKPEAFKNLVLSLDVNASEIWIARAFLGEPLFPVVRFRPLITRDWACDYDRWSAKHSNIHILVALAHRHMTGQGFVLPPIDALKKLTSRLALA